MKQVLNGSEIVLECLKEQGVDTVFGYPGGAILNIYDELYKQSDKIHHVLTSHEQGASHAADGYARATGKVVILVSQHLGTEQIKEVLVVTNWLYQTPLTLE